ncbi:DUF6158 family protein [Streptomyces sp. NPDC008313]|uniref:DUF6158 family protein n=1 Tax=Streptomyces sp. NPDC008313 TaxID=3364826 RepID=UPI0036E56EE1
MSDQGNDHGAAKATDASALDEQNLLRELESVHHSRHDTFLHGSPDALEAHNRRTAELEGEYVRRHPRRAVAAGRTREGARARVE